MSERTINKHRQIVLPSRNGNLRSSAQRVIQRVAVSESLGSRNTWWPRPRPVDRHGYVFGWYEPPIALPAESEIAELAEWLEQQGHSPHAKQLRLYFHRTVHARKELEQLVVQLAHAIDERNQRVDEHNNDLEKKIRELERERKTAQRELEMLRRELARALATAGIPRDPTRINFNVAPNTEVVAGREGVVHGAPAPVMSPALDHLARVLLGAIWGMCAFVVIGLVTSSHLNRWEEAWPQLLSSALVGATAFYTFGQFAAHATRIMARRLLERAAGEPPQAVSRSAKIATIASCAAAFAIIVLADIALEGHGIASINLERAMSLARLSGQRIDAAPISSLSMMVALLVATALTIAFMCSKVAQTFSECDDHQTANWIAHRQDEASEARLTHPKVKEAMALEADACCCEVRVRNLGDEIERLGSKRLSRIDRFDPESQVRIEAARVAASGEAAILHAHVDKLVAILDPLHGKSSWWRSLFARPQRSVERLVNVPPTILRLLIDSALGIGVIAVLVYLLGLRR